MEEFCKSGAQQNFAQALSSDFRDEVVVASLNSFNQCLSLQNRGIRLTHQEQPPQSVLIFGELTNSVTNASLDALTYDPKAVSCRSTGFSSNGEALKLDGAKSYKITKNFTIECKRTPKINAGNTDFGRTAIGLSTSLGPYTIELMQDQLFGFATASQAKANYEKVVSERDTAIAAKKSADAKAATLQKRIENASVEIAVVSTGEYSPPMTTYFQPRLYCGTNVEAHARSVCGERRAKTHLVANHGGNKCGYSYYVVSCLSQ